MGGGQAIYNLGTNKAHSLKEIAEIIVRLGKKYGYSPEIDICENGEWYNSSLDCSFFMKEFGWKPKLSIEDTIDGIYKSKIK